MGILSLPLFYYLARSIQKKISKPNNKNNELKRQAHNSLQFINKTKAELENLKISKELPEEFKKEVISFREQFIAKEEQNLDKLKKKIK